jgi:hypothetical protein
MANTICCGSRGGCSDVIGWFDSDATDFTSDFYKSIALLLAPIMEIHFKTKVTSW